MRQNDLICATNRTGRRTADFRQLGGTARCYQAIFVPSTALAGPGYDGQPGVYYTSPRLR
jgi:hypothetical protein